MHWLDTVSRPVASEGSLSLKVTDILDVTQIQRGIKRRGVNYHAGKGGEGESRRFLEENKERIRRHDFESGRGGGGGVGFTWARLMLQEL